MSCARLPFTLAFAVACSPARAPAGADGVGAPDAAPGSVSAADAAAPPTAATSSSSPSDDELERALGTANSKLEACRTTGLAQNARLSGHVRVKIRVAADGHVEAVDDQGSTLPSPAVVACFEDALRSLQMPRDAHPYEIVKSYTVLPTPDVWPTARDAGAPH